MIRMESLLRNCELWLIDSKSINGKSAGDVGTVPSTAFRCATVTSAEIEKDRFIERD